jgi:hypothetical protein
MTLARGAFRLIVIASSMTCSPMASAYGPMRDIGNLGILDPSWYDQSIQRRIAENAVTRPAQAEPGAPLLTTAQPASPVPARLASGYPAAERARAAATFAKLLMSYAEIERRFGIPAGDLGGAAAAFIAGNWMALHATDFPDAHFAALVQQMREAVGSEPRFAQVDAREKREAYEQLAIIGMFMATTQMGLKSRPDAATAQRSRDAAREYLQQFLQGDIDRLVLTEAGLKLR